MAALSEHGPAPLIDLREVPPAYLEPLLEEETAAWREELNWDFHTSADLVRRFLGMRALTGFALAGRTHAAGYAYYVVDEGKGLIGGLYVARQQRSIAVENTLVAAVLDAIWRGQEARRVEAQLMMLTAPLNRPVPYPGWFRPFARMFMEASLDGAAALPQRDPGVEIAPWWQSRQDGAARLIAEAYAGHIDSQINDQYRSPGGARRFLNNIVQYPGCGSFFTPASFVAQAGPGFPLCGICLASLVAPGVGHITQLCVAPAWRGNGLGYELLRRSLVALAEHGCRKVTLTVTAANQAALRLYQRLGFANKRDFAAYVWEVGGRH